MRKLVWKKDLALHGCSNCSWCFTDYQLVSANTAHEIMKAYESACDIEFNKHDCSEFGRVM